MRILVVEDETEIAEFLHRILSEDAHAVDIAVNGTLALDLAAKEPYDLIILDILLPGKNGLEVMKALRDMGLRTPVLMLTAKGEVVDRVNGLDAGADDYMQKPFAVAELRARVRALLRRNSDHKSSILDAGNLKMDLNARLVKVSDKMIELTNREFAVLEYLLANKGRMLSKGMIAEHVWDYHFDSDYNLIEVYIRRLRKKIEPLCGHKLIHTVRNSGYTLRVPVE